MSRGRPQCESRRRIGDSRHPRLTECVTTSLFALVRPKLRVLFLVTKASYLVFLTSVQGPEGATQWESREAFGNGKPPKLSHCWIVRAEGSTEVVAASAQIFAIVYDHKDTLAKWRACGKAAVHETTLGPFGRRTRRGRAP